MSLLGLLKHSALWERRWFQVIVAGRTFPGEWPEIEVAGDEMDAEDFHVDERDVAPPVRSGGTGRSPDDLVEQVEHCPPRARRVRRVVAHAGHGRGRVGGPASGHPSGLLG
jgi:hypothetical protein